MEDTHRFLGSRTFGSKAQYHGKGWGLGFRVLLGDQGFKGYSTGFRV